MSKLIGRLLVVLAFGWAGSASAALMAPVLVDGREWLQPSDFYGVNLQEIDQACGNFSSFSLSNISSFSLLCNGLVNGIDVTGYTWANTFLLNELFNYYLKPSGHTLNEGGCPPGLCAIVSTYSLDAFFEDFASPMPVFGRSVGGVIASFEFVFNGGPVMSGRVYEWPDDLGVFSIDQAVGDEGAWFYRDVPTPATLPLLGLGLAALGYSRRKRTQHNC